MKRLAIFSPNQPGESALRTGGVSATPLHAHSQPARQDEKPAPANNGLSWRIVYDVLYSKGIARYEVQ
jgi:hypothetical protein